MQIPLLHFGNENIKEIRHGNTHF